VDRAALSGDSLVALCQSRDGLLSLHFVGGLDSPSPQRLPWPRDFPPGVRPTCIAIVERPGRDESEVLLGSPEKALIVVPTDGGDGAHRQDTEAVPFLIAVTLLSRGRPQVVAVMSENGSLSVFPSDFSDCYLQVDIQATADRPPSVLAWCGRDAVALAWGAEGMVTLIDKEGAELVLEYPAEDVAVVGEPDGLRVVSEGFHEIVEVVADRALAKIRAIGSLAKGALLVDAHLAFREADAKCDEIMRQLCSEMGGDEGPDAEDAGDASLVVAVRSCLAAAQDEWDPAAQRGLLQAAAYGKAFVPHGSAGGGGAGGAGGGGGRAFSKNAFPDVCRKLRVLNHLRGADVAMPLTAAQYDALTPGVLVERLLSRCKHRAALAVADLLGLPGARDKALVDWACKKVEKCRAVADEELAREITARLARVSAVSYADIAAAADGVGRRVLATLLLDNEPRAADRVPILLKMREPRLALEKALEAGDADLVYMALDKLRTACRAEGADGAGKGWLASSGGERGGGERGGESGEGGEGGGDAAALDAPGPEKDDKDGAFFRVVLAYPRALDLLAAKLATAKQHEVLLRLLRAAGRWAAAGRVALTLAYGSGGDSAVSSSPKELFAALKRAAEVLREGERLAAGGRGGAGERGADAGALARATDDATALLAAQVELERDLKKAGADCGALAGGTLAATLAQLVALDGEWGKRAEKLAKDFKVSDAAWWWIKARTLVKARRYEMLRTWAERTHPLGFEPLVELLAASGAREEAKRYALKVQDAGARVGLLINLGALVEAAEAAAKSKDVAALESLAEKNLPPAAEEVVSRALAQLRR
jgi:hypothetical protein